MPFEAFFNPPWGAREAPSVDAVFAVNFQGSRNARRSIFRAGVYLNRKWNNNRSRVLYSYPKYESMNVCAFDGRRAPRLRQSISGVPFIRAPSKALLRCTGQPERAGQLGQPRGFSTETRRVSRTRLSDVCQVISRPFDRNRTSAYGYAFATPYNYTAFTMPSD